MDDQKQLPLKGSQKLRKKDPSLVSTRSSSLSSIRPPASTTPADTADITGTAYARRIAELGSAVRAWDTKNIVELLELFSELRRVALAFEQDPHWYVSQRDVPAAVLPGSVPRDKIWGSDERGLALVKDDFEFIFKIRPISELSVLSPEETKREQSVAMLNALRDEPRRKITIQLKESEYIAILKSMALERETKVAAWIRRAIHQAIKS